MNPPEQHPLIRRLLARREEHARRSLVYRIAFGVAGAIVLAAGVVMLVTPGPAFVLIPAGLAMLALEFEWAEQLLVKALVQAERARAKARGMSTARKVAGALAGFAAAIAALFVTLAYVV